MNYELMYKALKNRMIKRKVLWDLNDNVYFLDGNNIKYGNILAISASKGCGICYSIKTDDGAWFFKKQTELSEFKEDFLV